MPQSHDMGDDLLKDILAAFDQDEFDAGLDIFDNHRNALEVRSMLYIARGVAKKGYANEAVYMLHDLIWETKDGKISFRMHADNRPAAAPHVVGSYLWAVILMERDSEPYAYPETGTQPPLRAAKIFDEYLRIAPSAAGNYLLITDGLRAHFESIVKDAGIERKYDQTAIREALDIVDAFREQTYRVQGNGLERIPYRLNDRFLVWEACLHALRFDHPDSNERTKTAALKQTKRALNEYFDVIDYERGETAHHGRLPQIPREIGALVYMLKDETLIRRLEASLEPRSDLPDDIYVVAREKSDHILAEMQNDADNWPFIRVDVRGEAAIPSDDQPVTDIGPRALADDKRRRPPVRQAADEVGPRRDAQQPASEAEVRQEPAAEPRQPRMGRGSVQRLEIVGKKGKTQSVIVEKRPRRTPTTGQPRKGKGGSEPKS